MTRGLVVSLRGEASVETSPSSVEASAETLSRTIVHAAKAIGQRLGSD